MTFSVVFFKCFFSPFKLKNTDKLSKFCRALHNLSINTSNIGKVFVKDKKGTGSEIEIKPKRMPRQNFQSYFEKFFSLSSSWKIRTSFQNWNVAVYWVPVFIFDPKSDPGQPFKGPKGLRSALFLSRLCWNGLAYQHELQCVPFFLQNLFLFFGSTFWKVTL